MTHKAWCSIEEVPYCLPSSSIRFQGHTGWKIDDLNPVWIRFNSRLQLSIPPELPCLAYDPAVPVPIFPHTWGRLVLGGGSFGIEWLFHQPVLNINLLKQLKFSLYRQDMCNYVDILFVSVPPLLWTWVSYWKGSGVPREMRRRNACMYVTLIIETFPSCRKMPALLVCDVGRTWWRYQMVIFSTLLAFVMGIHRWPVNSPHKRQ